MLPVEGLGDERDVGGPAAAEEDRVDGHALRVLPVGCDRGALPGGGGEAGIGVRGGLARGRCPVVALPVDEVGRGLLGEALPPDIAIIGQCDVGEDAISVERLHGVGIRVHSRPGSDTEEASLGIDGVEAAVLAEAHPCDVVTNRLDRPAGDGGLEHREIGLAAGRGEGRGEVAGVARG